MDAPSAFLRNTPLATSAAAVVGSEARLQSSGVWILRFGRAEISLRNSIGQSLGVCGVKFGTSMREVQDFAP